MSHEQHKERLTAYLDGDLSGLASVEIEEHLLGQALDPLLGHLPPARPLEGEGTGHHAHGQGPLLPGDPGDHRRGAQRVAHAQAGEAVVRADLVPLAIWGVVNSLLSVYYYLKEFEESVYGRHPDDWDRVREAILARRLEGHLTKEEILYLYLNEIFYGSFAYGCESAAQTFFGKPARIGNSVLGRKSVSL